jgi:TnpA family transposase
MQKNSRAEAEHQLYRGDTHTLSIQRARNIQHAINFPDDLMRRWNKMFYRHMKKEALIKTINAPERMDDLDLAKVALQSK